MITVQNELGSREEFLAAATARMERLTPGASAEYRAAHAQECSLSWAATDALRHLGQTYLRLRESEGAERLALQLDLEDARAAHQEAVAAHNEHYTTLEGLRRRDAGAPELWAGLHERPPAGR